MIKHGVSGARWRLAGCDAGALNRLLRETGEDELLLRCLLNRGVAAASEVGRFLAPDFHPHLHPPSLLRDMNAAVERLRTAVARRERILIVTDFDVDGTTSSVILSSALRLIDGGDLIAPYIPDRFTEGYGLSSHIVERAAAEGFSVIVTADIGIKSHGEARRARELGIDLIICDHHLPDGEDIPADAFAVLCPKGSSGVDYPNKHLAACGVALKLADALLASHPKRSTIIESLAKLTAIGTVADMVDLANTENRAIVAYGLNALGQPGRNHGLQALLEIANVNAPVTSYDIGFKIGPRINAAGRIEHANTVLDLFNAPSRAEADRLAQELDKLNFRRQQIQQSLIQRVFEEIPDDVDSLPRVIVVAGREDDGFHRGVVGIACSKVVERFGRPTLICAINEQSIAHGSARSIDGFHMVEALDSVSMLLEKYGGHPMAAGFTIRSDRLPEFRARLNEYAAERLTSEDLGRTITADAEMRLDQITPAFIRSLLRLEPHGIGNPAPVFLLRSIPMRSFHILKEKHLKLYIGGDKRTGIEAVWWNAAGYAGKFAGARTLSLMCKPELNEWQGRTSCRLKIVDAAVEDRNR
ncbi:MAG: single-stranded-DNA-specific exonuclease RecJ [Blastocatellales bacterium]|nr:single-stranded-DNA-specific exonuclease RecJ [Blastocatellales bacterium]